MLMWVILEGCHLVWRTGWDAEISNRFPTIEVNKVSGRWIGVTAEVSAGKTSKLSAWPTTVRGLSVSYSLKSSLNSWLRNSTADSLGGDTTHVWVIRSVRTCSSHHHHPVTLTVSLLHSAGVSLLFTLVLRQDNDLAWQTSCVCVCVWFWNRWERKFKLKKIYIYRHCNCTTYSMLQKPCLNWLRKFPALFFFSVGATWYY